MRIVLVILLGVLLAASAFMAVTANKSAVRARRALEEERYKRLTAEERLQKTEQSISSLRTELLSFEAKLNGAETTLQEATAMNQDLRARLDAAAKSKKDLEAKLNALADMTAK